MIMMMKKETDRQAGFCSGWAQVIKPSPSSCMPQTTSELTYSRFNIVMSVGDEGYKHRVLDIQSPLQTVRPSVCLQSLVGCKFRKNGV